MERHGPRTRSQDTDFCLSPACVGDNQGFYRELRALGITDLLVDRKHHKLREHESFRTHFRLLYARLPVELYEVVGRPHHRKAESVRVGGAWSLDPAPKLG